MIDDDEYCNVEGEDMSDILLEIVCDKKIDISKIKIENIEELSLEERKCYRCDGFAYNCYDYVTKHTR